MTSFLSQDQQDSLRAQHKRERDKRICDRIKAVLLCDEGRSFAEIAHILLLDDQTVKLHVTEYLEQNKLTCNHNGSLGKLDSSQIAWLRAHLENHTYLYVKDIVAYVRAQWGIIYTVSISGALDILSKRVVIEESETLNTEFTLIFLKKLEQAYPEATKVYLFCDNARYYKNREVQAFLATSKLQMRFLPPYSPNLNPIERLWKWMNQKVLYNRYYERFKDFRDAVLGFLQGLDAATEDVKEALQSKVRDRFRVIGS